MWTNHERRSPREVLRPMIDLARRRRDVSILVVLLRLLRKWERRR